MASQLFLLAYDVRDPRRLAGTRKRATAWAHGGQHSVLECWTGRSQRNQMLNHVSGAISLSLDSMVMFSLGRGAQTIALGLAPPAARPRLVYIE